MQYRTVDCYSIDTVLSHHLPSFFNSLQLLRTSRNMKPVSVWKQSPLSPNIWWYNWNRLPFFAKRRIQQSTIDKRGTLWLLGASLDPPNPLFFQRWLILKILQSSRTKYAPIFKHIFLCFKKKTDIHPSDSLFINPYAIPTKIQQTPVVMSFLNQTLNITSKPELYKNAVL